MRQLIESAFTDHAALVEQTRDGLLDNIEVAGKNT